MATVTVLYPKGAEFNMDYYLSKHMPLAMRKWAQYGLKSWKVVEFDADAPYCVQAMLELASPEDQKRIQSSPEAEEVFGDVPNFSTQPPIILAGRVTGTS